MPKFFSLKGGAFSSVMAGQSAVLVYIVAAKVEKSKGKTNAPFSDAVQYSSCPRG